MEQINATVVRYNEEIKLLYHYYRRIIDAKKGMGEEDLINVILEETKKKDKYTYNHVINVNKLVDTYVKGLSLYGENMSEEEITLLKHAALLHDIGKLTIPFKILTKPDKLTEAEYQVMKRHVDSSVCLLDDTILEKYKPIIISHHENYDGSGYNQGLSYNNIPKLARILRILDSFEAMTGLREYNTQIRKTIDGALNELRIGAGPIPNYETGKYASTIKYDKRMVYIFIAGINSDRSEVVNIINGNHQEEQKGHSRS